MPGGVTAQVARAARQVARSAAWRVRRGAAVPAVEIVGYGETVEDGRVRAEETAEVFRAAFSVEGARLAGLGLPVPVQDLVRITARDFSGVPGGRLPADVVVTVDMPPGDLGTAALAAGEPELIRRAFAALDPGAP
ncbi:hypothetical protein [Amycolatopsis sp. NPDC051061]|uniref:hypothetical protein n=1 Tax=Amycolatopsis sp. NPDC051061 TaxID=3155042 RepID=UPI00342B36E1